MPNPGSFRFAVVAVAAVTLGSSRLAAQAFEGAVTYQLKSERGAAEMTQMYKGPQVRTEMSAGGRQMAMLLDTKSESMTMIMDEQKMYMTMDLKQMAAMGGQHAHEASETPKITELGTTETIAGRKCSNYLVGQKQDIEVCAAKGMGFFAAARNPMGGGPTGSLPELGSSAYGTMFKDGFFPLRVSKVEGGKKQVVLEATRVEQKSLDASLFTVPAGYSEMKMPGRP